MEPAPRSGLRVAVVLATIGVAVGVAYFFAPATSVPERTSGFVDRTRAAGIEFRMSFLPGEQGEKFKINFYDHGAGVRVKAGGRTLVRAVEAATGYQSQSSKPLHFGLGDATKIDSVEIRWPRGTVQTLPTIEIDGIRDVVEPEL